MVFVLDCRPALQDIGKNARKDLTRKVPPWALRTDSPDQRLGNGHHSLNTAELPGDIGNHALCCASFRAGLSLQRQYNA